MGIVWVAVWYLVFLGNMGPSAVPSSEVIGVGGGHSGVLIEHSREELDISPACVAPGHVAIRTLPRPALGLVPVTGNFIFIF